MAKVGAQRAAVLTGKSKSTIQRAMNSGKLSFELDQNDRRVIDVSELERVFGIAKTSPEPQAEAENASPARIEDAVEKERLRMQVKMLEAQLNTAHEHIEDLKEQREKWEKQASQLLITSQYSQRQAEELRAEIKEREERARTRRLQQPTAAQTPRQAPIRSEAQRSAAHQEAAKSAPAASAKPTARPLTQPEASTSAPPQDQRSNAQMKKLKAGNENMSDSSPSMFRFWKRAKA